MDDKRSDQRRQEDATFKRLIDLGIALSAERDHNRLMERILLEAKAIYNADGGTLYLRTEDNMLSFEIMRSDTLDIAMGGTTGRDIPFPPLSMYDPEFGEPITTMLPPMSPCRARRSVFRTPTKPKHSISPALRNLTRTPVIGRSRF